jgi:hypothetical protein
MVGMAQGKMTPAAVANAVMYEATCAAHLGRVLPAQASRQRARLGQLRGVLEAIGAHEELPALDAVTRDVQAVVDAMAERRAADVKRANARAARANETLLQLLGTTR